MNVLWDLRLFSYGYRDRGVGTYCREVASALLRRRPEMNIVVWADRDAVPETLQSDTFTWIPYHKGTWKSGMFILPWLIRRHRIDLLHYWVALGPLRAIGLTPWPCVPSVATVYDIGVELWDTPWCRAVKNSAYWSAQKRLFLKLKGILAISSATMQDITVRFPSCRAAHDVVYMPLTMESSRELPPTRRLPFFITLGGAAHKNCAAVVAAFARIRKQHPDFSLRILGEIDKDEESLTVLPDGVSIEPTMERYREYLSTASGLLFCSRSEGLGIPPLEAMRQGCPLLLSSIPPLLETCAGAGKFVDPRSIDAIARGIEDLIAHNALWAGRSACGAPVYRSLSGDAPDRCLRMYEKLTNTTIACNAPPPSSAEGKGP